MEARARGNARGASAALNRARKLAPENVGVLHLGAIVAHDEGRFAEALQLVDDAIARRPDDSSLLRSRGLICVAAGRIQDGISAFQAAILRNPNEVELRRHVARLLRKQGNLPEAIAVLNAVADVERDRDFQFELADFLREAGDLDGAIKAYERCCSSGPADVATLSNLATCLARSGRVEAAEKAFARALVIPTSIADGARLARAVAIFREEKGDKEGAIRYLETAVALEPENEDHRLALARGQSNLDIKRNSASWHRLRAISADPEAAIDFGHASADSLLFVYIDEDGPLSARAGREFGALKSREVESAYVLRSHANSPEGDRIIKIGYVSADFMRHAVSNFSLPIIQNHDRSRFRVHCFSLSGRHDDVTRRFVDSCDRWIDLSGLDDLGARDEITRAEIDVLVDLTGMTAFCRPELFVMRPAPVQVTYLGFPATTGLECFDARIVDPVSDPYGSTDSLFSEPLIRLAGPFLAYMPIDAVPPPVGSPPNISAGYFTFGCFCNYSKITETTLSLWRSVLDLVPGSRLSLKSIIGDDKIISSDIKRMISRAGLAGRVDLIEPKANSLEHMLAYGNIDIALDTFPYAGTTTTFESLWMGVPVVTLAGRPHASRVGASILTHAGLPELVAQDPKSFARICSELASDSDLLCRWRRHLRSVVLGSPACDTVALTRRLEQTYLDLWRRWCNKTLIDARRP